MRNEDIDLTPAQRANIGTRANQLKSYAQGDGVRVEYTKRNKDAGGKEIPAILEGAYESHTFNSDHGTVKVFTDKGYRSANLHTVTRIVRL